MLGNLDIVKQEAPAWAKAWHTWALFNVQALEHFSRSDTQAASHFVAPAVTGFFKAVSLGQYGGEQFSSFCSMYCMLSFFLASSMRRQAAEHARPADPPHVTSLCHPDSPLCHARLLLKTSSWCFLVTKCVFSGLSFLAIRLSHFL